MANYVGVVDENEEYEMGANDEDDDFERDSLEGEAQD